MRPRPLALSLALCAAFPAAAAAQCGSPGTGGLVPKLTIDGEMWDGQTTFTIEDALPGAGWIWLLDVSPGPLPSPYGSLCVGPTFTVLFNFLGGQVPIGPAGSVSLTFPVPATPATTSVLGVTFHHQVLVADPSGPGGAAASTGAPFTLRGPRVAVASDGTKVDLVDGAAATAPFPISPLASVTGGNADCAFSRDGERLYSRRTAGNANHGVVAWDVSGAAPVPLGEAVAPTPALFGKPRNGLVIANSDAFGYFVDDFWVHEFDADPTSPTFLTVTRSAASSGAGIDLAISNDDQRLFVTDGTNQLLVYDVPTMTETGAVTLSSAQGLLGFVLRYACEVSPNGKWLATIQQGVLVGTPTLDGLAMVNVVSIDPQSPAFLQEVKAIPLPNWGQMQLAFDPKDPSDATIVTLASDSTGQYELQVVDWPAGTVATHPFGVTNGRGNEDGGVGFSPNGSFLYATCRGNDSLHVFDASLNLVASTPLATSGDAWYVQVER